MSNLARCASKYDREFSSTVRRVVFAAGTGTRGLPYNVKLDDEAVKAVMASRVELVLVGCFAEEDWVCEQQLTAPVTFLAAIRSSKP